MAHRFPTGWLRRLLLVEASLFAGVASASAETLDGRLSSPQTSADIALAGDSQLPPRIVAQDVSLFDWNPPLPERKAGVASAVAVATLAAIDHSAPGLDRSAGGLDGVASGTLLALAITLNGTDRGIARLREHEGVLWIARPDLTGLGLALEPGWPEQVRLDSIEGIALRFDSSAQALDIVVPPSRLDAGRALLNLPEDDFLRADAASGALLNYQLYADLQDRASTLSALTELRAFAGPVLLSSTQLARTGILGSDGETEALRLDTALSIAWPRQRLSLRLGDFIGATAPWSRATRMGGFQFGTNFALQPYVVTTPVRTFSGSVTLPSQAELYVNGLRRYSGEIAPGPFEIGAGPSRIDGAGRAELVLTDMLGRVTRQTFSIYDTPRLLRSGLSDWSVEVGSVRRNYGVRSFDYSSDLAGAATWRRGLSNRLTLETHGEASRDLVNLGIGGTLLLGDAGVVSGSVAASKSGAERGHQVRLGYSWTNGRINLAGSVERASAHYADIAALHGAVPARASDFLQVGYSSERLGSFGSTLVRVKREGEPEFASAGLFWSRQFGDALSLSVSANQDLAKGANRSLFVSLNYVPGDRRMASLSLENWRGRNAQVFRFDQSVDRAGGLGWRGSLRHDPSGWQGTGQAQWLGPFGELQAGLASFQGQLSGFAGFDGSISFIDGTLNAGRRIDESFALVTTSGVPGVPVLLDNIQVGRTNSRGRLLVTGLRSYQRNLVAIRPDDLDAAISVPAVQLVATPADRGGTTLRFELRHISASVMVLRDRSGSVLPPGTPVRLAGGEPFATTVGFDGEFYLEDPPLGATIIAETPTGACRYSLPTTPSQGAISRLGDLACETSP